MVRMVVGAGCQSLPASMPANDDDGVGGVCVCKGGADRTQTNSHIPLL